MSAAEQLLASYQQQKGQEIAVGDWLLIDQPRIDAFAQATGDLQWIHIDPARAAVESPYNSTIAHGFLTLSLLPLLTQANASGQFEKNYPACGCGSTTDSTRSAFRPRSNRETVCGHTPAYWMPPWPETALRLSTC